MRIDWDVPIEMDDGWYRERSPDLAAITVPVLSAANWAHALHTRGNFEGYARAGSAQKWLEVHGLEHYAEFYTDYGVTLQKRDLADLSDRPGRRPDAVTIGGRDFQFPGDGPWPQVYGIDMKGLGIFLHNDPADRPAQTFAGTTTLHTGPDQPSYLLLPVIPPA